MLIDDNQKILRPGLRAIFLGLLFLCGCATKHSGLPLPPDVALNQAAGRGAPLSVTLRLDGAEDVPFVVDTGAARTLLDISFEKKLGPRLGAANMSHFGDKYKAGVYAAPKLYLDGVPLLTGSNVMTYDFKSQLKSRAGQRIKAVLGMDCLKHYCIQLDFDAGKMRFLDPNNLDEKKLGQAFPMTISVPGNRPFIRHAGLNGGTNTNELIDTGCTYDGRVEKGDLTGDSKGWVSLAECDWENRHYTDLNVQIGSHANLIGLRFLARHLVTLNFPKGILYLKQTRAGPLPNRKSGAGTPRE